MGVFTLKAMHSYASEQPSRMVFICALWLASQTLVHGNSHTMVYFLFRPPHGAGPSTKYLRKQKCKWRDRGRA